MAVIGNAFDLTRAINNQNYAYKCWLNYNKDGNTMRISDDDMKKVLEQWRGNISNWEAKAEQDVTEYSIEGDYEWNSALDEGKKEAKAVAVNDETKWGGSTTNSKNKNIANGVTAGVAGAGAAAGGIASMVAIAQGAANSGVGFMVAAPLVLAVGVLYEATRPNKNENKALQELKTLMETSQSNMKVSTLKMEEADIEITQLTTESEKDKTTTEEEIAKKQELIKVSQAVYNNIIARVKSGEPLSATDKEKLKACDTQIKALKTEIDTLQLSSIEFSTANSEIIESKKTELDVQAQNIANTKGTTDYAASFDEATNNGAKWQIATHSINFAAGITTTVAASIFASFPFQLWALIFAGMAAAGSGMSAHAIVEQSTILSNTNKELDVRNNTEEIIETSTTHYENKLGNMLAQNSFLSENIKQLESFEETEVTLEKVPTTSSDKNNERTKNPFGKQEV